MFVRIIDENGFFIRDDFVDKLTELTIETPCPSGFYRPKWNGEKWVEGGEVVEDKEQIYKNKVVEMIREIYTADDEYAILRKKLAGIDSGEFDIYNEFVEGCKSKAKLGG